MSRRRSRLVWLVVVVVAVVVAVAGGVVWVRGWWGRETRVDCGRILDSSGSSDGGAGSSGSSASVLARLGDDPDAALEYLAPADDGTVDDAGTWVPGQGTVDWWDALTTCRWSDASDGLGLISGAVAAASSFRNPDLSGGDDPGLPLDADARATYISGKAIEYFAGDAVSRGDFTETVKQNLAVVLANSPEEVAAAAANYAEVSSGGEGPSLAHWGVVPNDIGTVIFRFGDSQNAMAVLSTGVGDFHHRRIEEAMDAPDRGEANLRNQYGQLSMTSSYITELSRMRYEAGGLDGGAPWPPSHLLIAQAYGDAMNRGLLTDPGTLGSAVGREWAVIDPDDPDAPPTVDIKGLTDDQADDMTAWKKEAVTNEHDKGVLDGLDTSIGTNWNNGQKAAGSARTS